MRTGDAIATVAQPIAKGIDALFGTNIQGCAGCHGMQHNLNAGMSLADALYDRFWKKNKGNTTMQYIVSRTQTEQIAVEAESPKEAMDKAKKEEGQVTGFSETYSANPRPGQIVPQRPA